jgi:hypothetical protein
MWREKFLIISCAICLELASESIIFGVKVQKVAPKDRSRMRCTWDSAQTAESVCLRSEKFYIEVSTFSLLKTLVRSVITMKLAHTLLEIYIKSAGDAVAWDLFNINFSQTR